MKKLVIADLIFFNLSFLLAYWLRIQSGFFPPSPVPLSAYTSLLLYSNLVFLLVFFSFTLYRERKGKFTIDESLSLLKGLLLIFVVVMATTFLYKATLFSRLILSFSFVFSLFSLALSRLLVRYFYARYFQKLSYVLIHKDDAMGKRLRDKLRDHQELNYRFVGYIKRFKDVEKYKHQIDVVFITSKPPSKELADIAMNNPKITFKIVPDYLELIMEPLNFDEFADVPLITLFRQSSKKNYLALKRIIDVLLSGVLLLLLSPLFFLISLLVKITSKGPVIYKQQRIGKDEVPFQFYKFRTMHSEQLPVQLTNEVDYLFKKKYDPRITFIGKVLRRTCFDELPQLWNVLKGDMSLVGPRPHFKEELQALKGWQRKRFSVQPGMTGLWQISGRHELSFDKTVFLDIYYINHLSLLLDLKIMIKTIPAILFSGGKW